MGSKRTGRRRTRVQVPRRSRAVNTLVLTCMGHVPPVEKTYSPLRAEDLQEIREEVYSGSPIVAAVSCRCGTVSSTVYRDGADSVYARITHAVHCRTRANNPLPTPGRAS